MKTLKSTIGLEQKQCLSAGRRTHPWAPGWIPGPLGLCKSPFPCCDGGGEAAGVPGDSWLCYLLRISTAGQEQGPQWSLALPVSQIMLSSHRNQARPSQLSRGQGVREICQRHPPAGNSRAVVPRRAKCPGELPWTALALLSVTHQQLG